MAYVDKIDDTLITIGDFNSSQIRSIADSITSMTTSLTISGSSELSIELIDQDFIFAKSNFFQVRRDVFYRNLWFEIAAVETQRGDSVHPKYLLECRSKAVQLMKRDKKPEAYRGMSAYDFAQAIAKRFLLGFVGEKTTKKQAVVKGKSKDSDDSVWTVLQSLASEQQFVCFESEGTLFFCSEKFLLGKWGDEAFKFGDGKFIPFFYPDTTDPIFTPARDKWILLEQPRVRRSDDDIKAADGSLLVDRFNGVHLRPGMTIWLGGIPDFESFYIITDVSFQEGSVEPVQVSFRVPVDPTKEAVSSKGTKKNTSNKANTGKANTVATVPGQSSSAGTINTTPRKLTVSEARKYASTALGNINYKGTNGNLIIAAVANAITRLNNKVPLAEIEKQIKASATLTEAEKKHVFNIYANFALGLPVSSLGVSGGYSDSVVDSRRQELNSEFTSIESNRTPTINTVRDSGSAFQSTTFTSNADRAPARTVLPPGVTKAIQDFITTRTWGLAPIEIPTVVQLSLDAAKEIMKQPTTSMKISKYVFYYNQISTQTSYTRRMRELRYLAIRQQIVFSNLDKLIRESDLSNAGAFQKASS